MASSERPKPRDDPQQEKEKGDGDEDIYSEQGREALIDDEDEITDIDEGVMKGYEEDEKASECAECGKALKGEDAIETEIDGELQFFCSELCAEHFEHRQKR